MDFSERKPIRLCEYDYSQNGAYFVTICTDKRKKILSDIVGGRVSRPNALRDDCRRNVCAIPVKYPSVSVDKYVIMPDHIHLLLRFDQGLGTGNPSPTPGDMANGTGIPSPTLGNVIGWYKYQVTKLVNLQENTEERKLFQRSYYDHVIRNQRDYDEVWQYIENNPRKWILQNGDLNNRP